MQVSIDEVVLLLGSKEVELLLLKKQLAAAQKRIEELTPKADAQPELQAVR